MLECQSKHKWLTVLILSQSTQAQKQQEEKQKPDNLKPFLDSVLLPLLIVPGIGELGIVVRVQIHLLQGCAEG